MEEVTSRDRGRGGGGDDSGGVVSSGALTQVLQSVRIEMNQIDQCIKKLVQNNNRNQFQNGNGRQGGGRLNRNNFYNDNNKPRNQNDDRQNRKRPQETKTVFSRLSARHGQGDSDGEEEIFPEKKPRISSQVIRDMPTKQEVLRAQTGDEVSKARNRRMFGSLLGTLQKFKQEEIFLKNKEDKKAQIEQKIELQEKQERENQKKERQTLFAQRELKKATIKSLETKMARTLQFEKWEETQKPLLNYIITKAKPFVYWLPKKMTDEAQKRLDSCSKKHEALLEKKRAQLHSDLQSIEERCLRNARIPADAKPASLDDSDVQNQENDEVVNETPDENTPRPITIVKQENEKEDKKLGIKIKQEGERQSKTHKRNNNEHSTEDESEEDSSSSDDDDEDEQSDDDEDEEEPVDVVMKNPKKEKDADEDTNKTEVSVVTSDI